MRFMRDLELPPKEAETILKERKNLLGDVNLATKLIMADELYEIGLSKEAISRQLNIAYKGN